MSDNPPHILTEYESQTHPVPPPPGTGTHAWLPQTGHFGPGHPQGAGISFLAHYLKKIKGNGLKGSVTHGNDYHQYPLLV